MRRSILALTLAAVLSLAASTSVAAAQADQTISINGPAMFFSILGGNSNGTATLSGDVSQGVVGNLRGTINFALRDESLTVSPSGTMALTTDLFPVSWQVFRCDQFGCYYTFGTAQYERRYASGPVDLRLGSLKGAGTLSINSFGDCVSNCPPPGAYAYPPQSSANLTGGVTGSKDAGTLSIYAIPVIH
jgi:hypothetical protein